MIFDKVADEPGAAALISSRRLIRSLVERGVIELLVTHVQEDQIAAIRDEARREQLQRAVPRRVVPTHGAVWDVSKWDMARWTSEPVAHDIARIQGRNKAKDALIGVTAKFAGATLVTEDSKLSKDAAVVGVAVASWSQFIALLKTVQA